MFERATHSLIIVHNRNNTSPHHFAAPSQGIVQGVATARLVRAGSKSEQFAGLTVI